MAPSDGIEPERHYTAMKTRTTLRNVLWTLAGVATVGALAQAAPSDSDDGNEPTGTVTGLIRYDGKVPASWLPKDDGQTAKRTALTEQTNLDPTQLKPPRPIVITKDGGIRNVVVALESEAAIAILKKKEFPPTLVDQIGGVFVPAVTVVPPGGKVLFHNADQINHNVHLISPNQKEYNFNIGHDQKRTIRLGDDPNDTIRVVCDLHAWMRASLVVVPTPYYCVSDQQGRFRIDGVPPGTYHLKLYHQRLGAAGKLPDVVVSAGQETAVDAKMVRSRRRR